MNKTSAKIVLAAVILVSVPGFAQNGYVWPFAQNGYVWPIKLAPDLSSRFCDHRAGHFHAGLDFRTNGKSGYKIYAIEDGYVFRVSIAHNGYGKALYLKLNDGMIAVYGHLSSLGEDLDEYVRKEQMKTRAYGVLRIRRSTSAF
jgi:murein DD-endopeptidase MepM/ murein hydrolase activator NlpD